MSTKTRWFAAIVLLTAATLILSTAIARTPHASSAVTGRKSISPASPGPSFPSYVPGSFTFTTPLQFIRPLNMVEGEIDQSAEPEIKIDIFGNIYVTGTHGVPGGLDFWKSTDKGGSFVYLGQPDGAEDKCSAEGPVLCQNGLGGGDDSIAVSNGGYLYISSLWAGNVTMSTTYDGGTGGTGPDQAWKVNPVSAGLGSDDREWIASYGPQTVYMTYNVLSFTNPPGDQFGLFFVKSTDGGKTFGAPVAVTPLGTINLVEFEGNLVVDQYNGNIYTAYIPQSGDNIIDLLRSTDGGATWTSVTAYTGPAGTSARGVFPILAVDRGGNLHLAFTKSDASGHTNCHVFLTSTSNPADPSPTWTVPVQIDSGPGNTSACLPWIVAGSPGIVDVTWYGSTSPSPDTVNSTWSVYFAQVTNAMTGSPTIAQNQVETPVVHDHSICFDGGGCASSGIPQGEPANRDLAEYYTMTLDSDGNANIAYEDSINGGCETEMDPLGLIPICTSKPWFSKQTAGPSAYAPPAGPSPATFSANSVLPSSSGHAEPNMKADSHNCLFSASPGGPVAWKSADAGFSFNLLPNPVADETGLIGGDEDILPVPQASGARPDQIYFADLGVSTVHIRKSTDGGGTWFAPGTGGAAGEVSASVDRQWMSWDRNGADTTVYLWEHEFVSQILRMSALTDDMVWSPFASGMTDPELLVTDTTIQNTVPGPAFVDPATHRVYGFLSASTPTTNVVGAPAGKLPNVWEADGAGTFTAGVTPGPFTNHPVFKGLIDSPTALPSPAPSPNPAAKTVGANTANLFNGATIDKAGNIYATWATPSGRTGLYDVWFASSRDHGQTYYGPFKVNPNGTQGNMPWIAAGDNGRVEIVYYATTGTQDPTTSTTDQWTVFFAQSLNAADREPVFTTSQASDHITHQGPICNIGILCSGGTRQLLDFFQVAIGPDGLANIAYADTGASNGTPHVSYARQSGGPLALTNPSNVTCLTPPPPPTGAVSRKTHGSAGTFDISLLSGCGIEDRSGGSNGDYQVVVTFPVPVTVQGATVSSSDNMATADAPTGSGGTVITVNIHHVSNAQQVTITLIDVSSGAGDLGNVSVPMKVLIGDTNCDGFVNSADISQTKAQSGQSVGSGNFREDVNVDGFLNSGDISLVKAKSGTALP